MSHLHRSTEALYTDMGDCKNIGDMLCFQAMAQPGQYLSVFIPEKMLKQIEDFRYRERIPSRVEAIRELISRALALARKKE